MRAIQITLRLPGLRQAFLLGLVLALTLACARRAYAVASVLNQMEFTVVVPPGGVSAATAWPVVDSPVLLSASVIRTSSAFAQFQGTGFVQVTYFSFGSNLAWTGLHGDHGLAGGDRVTTGYTLGAQDMLWVNAGSTVVVRPTDSLREFQIRNDDTVHSATVVVQLVW